MAEHLGSCPPYAGLLAGWFCSSASAIEFLRGPILNVCVAVKNIASHSVFAVLKNKYTADR